MRAPLRTALAAAFGLAFAAAAIAPAAAADSTPAPAPATDTSTVAGYTPGSGESNAANDAFFQAVMDSVAKKRAANPDALTVTVTYSTANAPSFRSQIATSTSVWNNAVNNVHLQEGSNADFAYYEGNDPRGSYASTDMHGHGYIFLDYAQNQQYYSPRVVTHETGHVLGLYDNYSGPCSELMSGGGPGTSCTNVQPNSTERNRVEQLWINGLKQAMAKQH